MYSIFVRLKVKKEAMNFQSTRRRGEDGVAMVINFLLSNARLVLGVGGAAILGIATLAVKRVCNTSLFPPKIRKTGMVAFIVSYHYFTISTTYIYYHLLYNIGVKKSIFHIVCNKGKL